jgi:hypothetical protein
MFTQQYTPALPLLFLNIATFSVSAFEYINEGLPKKKQKSEFTSLNLKPIWISRVHKNSSISCTGLVIRNFCKYFFIYIIIVAKDKIYILRGPPF